MLKATPVSFGDGPTPPAATELSPGTGPQRARLTLDDGYRTNVYVHAARGDVVRQPVLYLHGVQSHPGWFTGSASMLAGQGHRVYQVTRRGSGANDRDRGHARSATQLLQDVECAARLALTETGAEELAMVGVSWGGKLAAAYCLWPGRRAGISSLTMIAPGIVPKVDVGVRTKLAVVATLLAWPRCLLNIPLSDVELFTNTPRKRAYLAADGFRLHRATSRFMYASRSLDRMLSSAADGALNVPVGLILASDDLIIDNAATLERVARLAGSRLEAVTLDAAHVLEFEPATEAFFATLGRLVQRTG